MAGLAGSGIECPPTDRKLVQGCISYLNDSGFLPPPSVLNARHEAAFVS